MSTAATYPGRHHLPILPALIVLIGLARIAMAMGDDYADRSPASTASEDAVIIRRATQLVSAGVYALAAHYGLGLPAGAACEAVTALQPAGHHHE